MMAGTKKTPDAQKVFKAIADIISRREQQKVELVAVRVKTEVQRVAG